MIIQEVHVRNFRSILDATLDCDRLTAIVGRNGAGKSSLLQVLELFYDPSARVSDEDFYSRDVASDIEIAVTYSELSTEEVRLFSDYVDGNTLKVIRIFSLRNGATSSVYHGVRLQNLEFAPVRAAGGKREITAAYSQLKATDKYSGLPAVRAADVAVQELGRWESAHPAECVRRRDDGQFFGFTGAGDGNLGRYTRFLKIPAVRDATSDAVERRGSAVSEIMDLVVRNALAAREDVAALKERVQADYQGLLDPSKLSELAALETQLAHTLRDYAPDAGVSLRWSELGEIDIPMPSAEISLTEDGYESPVDRTGHGLQRAFIVTMLQHLVAARRIRGGDETDAEEDDAAYKLAPSPPNLVLAVEEPELYLHPTRQRHMASVLLRLAEGVIAGVAKQTQVIYTTHSPQFVGLDRFDQIRLCRKLPGAEAQPKTTTVTAIALDSVAEQLWELHGQKGEKYTAVSLRPRMQAVMTTSVNEGFFADVVVLVEGEGDRAVVIAVADAMRYDLDSLGIAVVACNGKASMDRPALVFRSLGIPAYLIWDNDKFADDPRPEENRRLLHLLGATEEDWPNGVSATHACMEGNLESVLRAELTPPVFDGLLENVRDEVHLRKKQALKNPFVLREVVERAAGDGRWSATLQEIVTRLVAIRDSHNRGMAR